MVCDGTHGTAPRYYSYYKISSNYKFNPALPLLAFRVPCPDFTFTAARGGFRFVHVGSERPSSLTDAKCAPVGPW